MPQRRHDIDALRVFAFALLIPYHASGIWQTGSDFHIVSTHQLDWMDAARIVVNRWRMPLIFAISGMAIALAAPASRGRFALQRSWRLLLPLVFGMFTTVSIQAYCEGVSRGHIEPGFLHFWLRYIQVRPWPDPHAFSGAAHGITWNHLWYLPYLWCYTMLLMLLHPMLESTRLNQWTSRLRHVGFVGLLLFPSLSYLGFLLWLKPHFPETHALAGDWYLHAVYFSSFLAGWWMAKSSWFWRTVSRWRWLALAISLVAIGIELALKLSGQWIGDGPLPGWVLQVNWSLVEAAARATYGWVALLAIFGFASRHLNRPFGWLPYATEAVYPWYMLHQTLLVLIAYWVLPMHWSLGAEVLVILGGTVLGCALLHELLIRRISLLRPLFGLKPRTPFNHATARMLSRQALEESP